MNHVRLMGRETARGEGFRKAQVELEGIDLQGLHLKCDSEDGELKKVLVHPPKHLSWSDETAINSVQMQNPPPPRAQVMAEHMILVDALVLEGAQVYSVAPHDWLPEGVYQRDSLGVIGDKAYAARFRYPVRQRETALCRGTRYPWQAGDVMEFGDMLVFPDAILVGLGQRSNMGAVGTLQREAGSREVIPVPLTLDALHLDYAMTIGGRGRMRTMVRCPGLFADKGDIPRLESRFGIRNAIDVPFGRHTEGWTNLFFINPETVVSTISAKDVNDALRGIGFKVIAVPFDGILRGEGAPRCCTAPLERAD